MFEGSARSATGRSKDCAAICVPPQLSTPLGLLSVLISCSPGLDLSLIYGRIALPAFLRPILTEEVLSGRVAQLEKQAVGVLSRFVVANDMDAEIKRAFVLRPHLVDGAAGFVRMDVLSPEDMPNEIWLMTYWADIASYRTWHKSHAYHESHAGIPKGLKLVPGSAALRIFNLIAS